jgi:hypothetical protein
MMGQDIGWFQHNDEGSKGEGLSRFLSGQFLVQNGFLGRGIEKDYSVAGLWLNSPRQDFINNAPDDNGYNATNGCTTLFIYYLFNQLGFSIAQIVAAGACTLAGVYQNLKRDTGDPFPQFKGLLDNAYPPIAVRGTNPDDPWPIATPSGAARVGPTLGQQTPQQAGGGKTVLKRPSGVGEIGKQSG